MSNNRILDLDGRKVWWLDSSDLPAAAHAISTGAVAGIAISPSQGYKHSDLHCLGELPKFPMLSIVYPENLDVSYIEQLPHLTYLQFGGGQSKSCNLDCLPNLQQLRIELDKKQKLPSKSLPSLKELAIWNLSDIDLKCLAPFSDLQSLELIDAKKLTALSGIEACKGLLSLDIAYSQKLEDIDGLAQLPMLQILSMKNTKAIKSYVVLEKLTQLKKLRLLAASPVNSLSYIAELSHIESVVIRNTPIVDGNLAPLKALQRLTYAYLDEKKEYEPVLGELKRAGLMQVK